MNKRIWKKRYKKQIFTTIDKLSLNINPKDTGLVDIVVATFETQEDHVVDIDTLYKWFKALKIAIPNECGVILIPNNLQLKTYKLKKLEDIRDRFLSDIDKLIKEKESELNNEDHR